MPATVKDSTGWPALISISRCDLASSAPLTTKVGRTNLIPARRSTYSPSTRSEACAALTRIASEYSYDRPDHCRQQRPDPAASLLDFFLVRAELFNPRGGEHDGRITESPCCHVNYYAYEHCQVVNVPEVYDQLSSSLCQKRQCPARGPSYTMRSGELPSPGHVSRRPR